MSISYPVFLRSWQLCLVGSVLLFTAAGAAAPGDSESKDSVWTYDPGDPFGATDKDRELGGFRLRMMLQTSYSQSFGVHSDSTSADRKLREENIATDGDGWRVDRLFMRIATNANDWLAFKSILDFAELLHSNTSSTVKQAYVTAVIIPKRFEVTSGVFKLPFSTLELDSIYDYELADVGRIDELIKNLGYGGKDIGAKVMVAPLKKPRFLHLELGLYRGHAHDEHASPLGAIGSRVESVPWKGLRFGLDWVTHLRTEKYLNPFDTSSKNAVPNPDDPFYPNQDKWLGGSAWSADISYHHKRLMLRGEGVIGKRIDYDKSYGARTFAGGWVLAGYDILHHDKFTLEPVVRFEFLDADREHSGGRNLLYSLGLNLRFSHSARLLFDLSYRDYEKNTAVLSSPKPLPEDPYLALDATCVTVQFTTQL